VWTERNTRDVLTAGVEDVEEWCRRLDVHLPYGCGNIEGNVYDFLISCNYCS
jgi:hypothetical protein